MRRLTEREAEEERPFRSDLTYAYFAARFGWTPDEYGSLTPVQRALIRKEIERQTVEESTVLERAFETAIGNAMRKKGRKRIELWLRRHSGAPSEPPVTKGEFDSLKAAFAARASG